MKQYQFNLKDECMKELPSMKEPKSYTGHPDNDHEIILYINRLAEYEKHLASLQLIPVPKGYLNQFIDEKIYDEVEINWRMKYPEQKVDDTELWIEVLKIANEWNTGTLICSYAIEELQKRYTITRKNNQ